MPAVTLIGVPCVPLQHVVKPNAWQAWHASLRLLSHYCTVTVRKRGLANSQFKLLLSPSFYAEGWLKTCLRIIICTLEISERGELSLWHLRVEFCTLGLFLQGHKGRHFVLEGFHFLFCRLCLWGNCSPHHFQLTTIFISDNCLVINSDWGTLCRTAERLPPCLRWPRFLSTWAINGILGPCG